MTLHVSRLPFALDPLIREAKRRMWRRRLLVAAVLALAIAGTIAAVIATRSPSQANVGGTSSALQAGTRSCGILGLGIGWHVSAGRTTSCRSGMTLMRAYLRGSPLADRTVLGYACTSHREGGRIDCVRGKSRVTAIANN